VDFTALESLLVHLIPQSPPHVVVIDRTEWHFGQGNLRFPTPVNVLTVGIGHDGMTIPVVWRALPNGGGSGQADHTDMLEKLLDVIEPSSIKAVLADREFISTTWLRQMQQREIPFCIRLRSDRRIGDSEEGPALPARMFARLLSPGTERILEGERYLFGGEGSPVPVRVVYGASDRGTQMPPFWSWQPGRSIPARPPSSTGGAGRWRLFLRR